MLDKYHRNINYMRISLTDRCNLRCVYCRPGLGLQAENSLASTSFGLQTTESLAFHKLAHSEVLRYEEILRIAHCAVALGITRFKITGGEPLVRKGAVDFIAKLKQIDGVEQVTLTTNGMILERNLPQLLACKIDGINISLDTLDKELYKQITGGGELEPVLNAIGKAVAAGLKCKLNCVPIKNSFVNSSVRADSPSSLKRNETEADLSLSASKKNILDLVEFAGSLDVPLRFIELMPLSCNNKLASLNGYEIRQFLSDTGYKLERVKQDLGNGPAVYYEASKDGQSQIIGFIEPLHHKFCGSCNRVRLTSTGQLKPCLYSKSTLDLRQLLRSGSSDSELTEALKQAIYDKPMGHHFEEKPANFNMNEIGG